LESNILTHTVTIGGLEVDAKDNGMNTYNGVVGVPIQFDGDVQGGTPPYTYHWTFGDGDHAYVIDPTHTYNSMGDYVATLTVTDSQGLTGSDTADVHIISSVQADLSGPSTGVEHHEVTFTCTGSAGSGNYYMDIYYGDGDSYHIRMWNNPEYVDHTYIDPGTYTVTLTITDLSTSQTDTDQITITISNDNNYVYSVDLSGPSGNGIIDVSYTFTATVTGSDATSPYDYYFDFDDGDTATYTNVGSKTKSTSHSYDNTGTYHVSVEVIDGNNEQTSDTFTFTVSSGNQAPTLSNLDVTPDTGYDTTSFTFSVVYTDPDGDAPTVYDVLIDDQYWGVASYYRFPMTRVSGNYQTGATYQYTTSGFWSGTHQFRFEFNDGEGHNVMTAFQSGPSIEGWANPLFAYPDIGWTNHQKARDNDLSTSAKSDSIISGTTAWIELSYGGISMHSHFPPLNCDMIRFKAYHSLRCRQIEIHVYRTDINDWYEVYDGTYLAHTNFIEKSIPGGPYPVNAMRIRFQITVGLTGLQAELFEADFHNVN